MGLTYRRRTTSVNVNLIIRNSSITEMEVLDKCPEFQLVVPCQCRERKSGLDITCENVETRQLKTVTDNMKKYKQRQDFTVW